MKKLIRVTTADISLDGLLQGQLRFLNQYFEVVGLAADTGSLSKVAEREGIRTIDVPMHREISLIADLKSLWDLIKVFRKEKPYIVHSNTPKGSLLSLIAAKIAGVPHRIYLVTGLRYQGTSGLFRSVLMMMERITCFFATKVIPEGNGVKKALYKDRITSKPLEVIHHGNINGKDTSYWSIEQCPEKREDVRKRLGLKDDDFAFVSVGRIVNDKGMHELALAMQRLNKDYPYCKVILVGRFEPDLDPLLPEDERYLLTNESIIRVGENPEVRPFYAAADALVFPSYREGFPNVVLEAGAMGLPSIVTDINGCNETIEEGVNGVIIPPKDADALYQAMKCFLDNPEKVQAMIAPARKKICDDFEQKDLWNALLNMYNSLDK